MSFCRDAALMSMRKVIKDKSPEEIKLLSKNDLEKPVTMDDFTEGNLLRGIVNCHGQKYSRLRCLLRVKGLVIGFNLGWSGHTLLIRKI